MITYSKLAQKTLFFLIIPAFLVSPLSADTFTVTVKCSNGANITKLQVEVFDSLNVSVPDVSPTDSNGEFVIENSETYTAPFYMCFKTPSGSMCGNYSINEITPATGSVMLNYYPTNLSCSCSKLVH
jgi:hypothetical protein